MYSTGNFNRHRALLLVRIFVFIFAGGTLQFSWSSSKKKKHSKSYFKTLSESLKEAYLTRLRNDMKHLQLAKTNTIFLDFKNKRKANAQKVGHNKISISFHRLYHQVSDFCLTLFRKNLHWFSFNFPDITSCALKKVCILQLFFTMVGFS